VQKFDIQFNQISAHLQDIHVCIMCVYVLAYTVPHESYNRAARTFTRELGA